MRRSRQLGLTDEGCTGDKAHDDAKAAGVALRVVKLPEAKKGFVLLPRRWLVRFRRLSRDFERIPHVLAALHFLVFVTLMLPKAIMFLTTGESA